MIEGLLIPAAFLLDALLGDPRRIPHPVTLIARLAVSCETLTRRLIPHEKTAGIITTLTVLTLTGGTVHGILYLVKKVHPVPEWILSLYFLYASLAFRGLAGHALQVEKTLKKGKLDQARKAVGMMVGRDTENLSEPEIARAAVESVGENMVDGITGPLFAMLLFGPAGVWIYKAASTLDSLFGYKNDRYLYFGWASARIDDLLAFLPARLTFPFTALAALFTEGRSPGETLRVTWKYRNHHDSPNAAYGEAAMAAGLGVRLGGTVFYGGIKKEQPFLGEGEPVQGARDIHRSVRLMTVTVLLFLITGLVVKEGLLWFM